MTEAWLYDGENAVRQRVTLGRTEGELVIGLPDGGSATVPPDKLVHVESRKGCEVLGRRDIQGWRLGVPADAASALAGLLPGRQRYGGWIDRIGLVPAVLIGLGVSAGILFAASRLPVWLAPYVPPAWEEKFGDTLVGDFGGRFCNGPGGQAALDKLTARLSPRASALNVRVVRIPMVNAAALPGGNIVVFEELIKESDGPDELAGVLAHEIAHIEERHVTQALIREFGFGIVISALGGSTGANIDTLMATRYSRDAEREADRDAMATLARANISPLPTAAFFQRLAKQEEKLGALGTGLSYVSTHPMSAERQRQFRESARRGRSYAPSLSPDEWDALFSICREPVSEAQD